jgi:hypothetical protein
MMSVCEQSRKSARRKNNEEIKSGRVRVHRIGRGGVPGWNSHSLALWNPFAARRVGCTARAQSLPVDALPSGC